MSPPFFQNQTWTSLLTLTSHLVILRWTSSHADLGVLFSNSEEGGMCRGKVLEESNLGPIAVSIEECNPSDELGKREDEWEEMNLDFDDGKGRRKEKKKRTPHQKLSKKSKYNHPKTPQPNTPESKNEIKEKAKEDWLDNLEIIGAFIFAGVCVGTCVMAVWGYYFGERKPLTEREKFWYNVLRVAIWVDGWTRLENWGCCDV